LRIWHIIASDRWTGAADPAASLAKALRERGHVVYFTCIGGRSLQRRVERMGLPLVLNLRLNRNGNIIDYLRDAEKIAEFCKAEGIEIIHTHLSADHWIAGLAIWHKKLPVRLIRTRHRTNPLRGTPLQRLLFGKLCDGIIDVSLRAQRRTHTLFPDKSYWVPGAVDADTLNPEISGQEVRGALGFGRKDFLVGIISHFHPNRGHRWLFESYLIVRAKAPFVKLVAVGEGDNRPFKRLAEEMGIGDSVRFLRGNEYEWGKIVRACDATVYLAEGSEGSARALLEAMACALPVVGADVGAVPEIIDEGRTGFIVPKNDRVALAEAILALAGDENLAKRMGSCAREKVERIYTQHRRAEAVERVYEEVLYGERLEYIAQL